MSGMRIIWIIAMPDIDVFIVCAACHVIWWCNLRIPMFKSELLDDTPGVQGHDLSERVQYPEKDDEVCGGHHACL